MADPEINQQWLSYATKIAGQGRLNEAIQALERVLEECPDWAEGRTLLIELATQVADFTRVVHHLMDCSELARLAGDQDLAQTHYETLLGLEGLPQVSHLVAEVKPEIFLRLGEFQLEAGKVDLALPYLHQSRQLKAGVGATHLALGRAYMLKEMHRDAIGEFQEVLRLSQNDAETQAQAYFWLGEVFVLQGRPPASTIVWFERAAQLYLQNGMELEAGRAVQAMSQTEGGHEAKLDIFLRLKASSPDHSEILWSLGNLYVELERYAEAELEFRTLLRHNLNHQAALLSLGQVCQRTGQWRDAALAFKRSIHVNPRQGIGQERMAELFHQQKLIGEAIDSYLLAALAYLEGGERERAIRLYQIVLGLDPSNPQACRELTNLGASLIGIGNEASDWNQ